MRILNIVPVYGKPSETFIKQRILANNSYTISNDLFTDKVLENYDAGSVYFSQGRNSGVLKKIYFKILDLFTKNHHTFKPSNLSKVLDKTKYDVIHLHFGYQAYSFLKALQLSNYTGQVFISLHGSDVLNFPKIFPKQGETIRKIVARNNATLVAPTKFLKYEIINAYSVTDKAITTIPNTFNPSFIESKTNFILKPRNHLKVICVSRFVPWKGHKYIVEGFSAFKKKHGSVADLYLVGSGPEFKNIKKMLVDFSLEDSVHLLGSIDHDEVQAYMKQSNVFLHAAFHDRLTNQQESFGIVLLEAIAAKLFCITTLSGGLADVVGEANVDNIKVIDENNSESIFNRLEELFLDGGVISDTYVELRTNVFSEKLVNEQWKNTFFKNHKKSTTN